MQDCRDPRKGDASRAFSFPGCNVTMTLGLASEIDLTLAGKLLMNGGTQHISSSSALAYWTADRGAFFP